MVLHFTQQTILRWSHINLVETLVMNNLFLPRLRTFRDVRASMPVISEMWLSGRFRRVSCCRFDKCWIFVIRLCWRLRDCSPWMEPRSGNSSRQPLSNGRRLGKIHLSFWFICSVFYELTTQLYSFSNDVEFYFKSFCWVWEWSCLLVTRA